MGAVCSSCSEGDTMESKQASSRTTEKASSRERVAEDSGRYEVESSLSSARFPGEYEGPSRPSTASAANAEVAWVFEEHPTFWEGVAAFLQQLPRKSKEKIWEHATSKKRADGTRDYATLATRKRQFEMLLTDMVLVYLKILYKHATCPISKEHVAMLVKPLAPWLMDRCGKELQQTQFYERDYLPDLITEYQRNMLVL